jgi:hypothetical protein
VAGENGIFLCQTCDFQTDKKGQHLAQIPAPETQVQGSMSMSDVMSMFLKHQETTQEQHLKQTSEMLELVRALVADRKPDVKVENNNILTNNQSFNLQFFLNEECKHAMNFSDFIKTISVTLEDIQHIGAVGYHVGMAKIISTVLRDSKTRPMHCTDAKRETMYVKENDEWHRDFDCEEASRLIRNIVSNNYKALAEWRATLPEQLIHETPEYEAWYSMSRNMCNTDQAALKKLIRHLATVTAIEKGCPKLT